MMIDQYKEQYKKETEEIHAPADLIAKTKAAVREEEARIRQEREMQTVQPVMQEMSAVQKKSGQGITARKWAYPLTAAAAICVLVSVSVMMRGLGKSSSDSTSYEMAAEADSGAESFAPETAAGAAESGETFIEEETSEETAEGAEPDMEMASAEDVSEAETGNAVSDMGAALDSAASTGGVTESEDETERAAYSDELPTERKETENVMSPKQEETVADDTAAKENISVKRVLKKPVFADDAGTESRTYEGMVFQVAEEGDGWVAYVASENGGGYVIRGEAETIEAFLAAGYQKLKEEK